MFLLCLSAGLSDNGLSSGTIFYVTLNPLTALFFPRNESVLIGYFLNCNKDSVSLTVKEPRTKAQQFFCVSAMIRAKGYSVGPLSRTHWPVERPSKFLKCNSGVSWPLLRSACKLSHKWDNHSHAGLSTLFSGHLNEHTCFDYLFLPPMIRGHLIEVKDDRPMLCWHDILKSACKQRENISSGLPVNCTNFPR